MPTPTYVPLFFWWHVVVSHSSPLPKACTFPSSACCLYFNLHLLCAVCVPCLKVASCQQRDNDNNLWTVWSYRGHASPHYLACTHKVDGIVYTTAYTCLYLSRCIDRPKWTSTSRCSTCFPTICSSITYKNIKPFDRISYIFRKQLIDFFVCTNAWLDKRKLQRQC